MSEDLLDRVMEREVELEISLIFEVLGEGLEFGFGELFEEFDGFRRERELVFVEFHGVAELVDDLEETELHEEVEEMVVGLEEGEDEVLVQVVVEGFLSDSLFVDVLGEIHSLDCVFKHECSAVHCEFQLYLILKHVVWCIKIELQLADLHHLRSQITREIKRLNPKRNIPQFHLIYPHPNLQIKFLNQLIRDILLRRSIIKQPTKQFLMILEVFRN